MERFPVFYYRRDRVGMVSQGHARISSNFLAVLETGTLSLNVDTSQLKPDSQGSGERTWLETANAELILGEGLTARHMEKCYFQPTPC